MDQHGEGSHHSIIKEDGAFTGATRAVVSSEGGEPTTTDREQADDLRATGPNEVDPCGPVTMFRVPHAFPTPHSNRILLVMDKKKGSKDVPRETYKTRARQAIGNLGRGFAEGIAVPAGGHHGTDKPHAASVRRFTHNGHECVIETHYKITVDGKPFAGHLSVNARGNVHHHGLPNYAFPSAVDLVKTVLDASARSTDVDDELSHIYQGSGEGEGHGRA